MLAVGIIGGAGYTGAELLRLLAMHDQVDVKIVTSREYAGIAVGQVHGHLAGYYQQTFVYPDENLFKNLDLLFFATPHGVSMNLVPALLEQNVRVIDLSADYRLRDSELWKKWYGGVHTSENLLNKAVYGLPELNRGELLDARLVACPGCYPTAVQLGFAPLLTEGLIDCSNLIASAASGTSGAGRKASLSNNFSEIGENFKSYGVSGHRHLPEIEQELSKIAGQEVKVTFVPHLVPMVRGIQATLFASLKRNTINLQSIFDQFYQSEKFVEILPRGIYPQTRNVRGSNIVQISIERPDDGDTVVVMVIEDNLVKGASGQAIQCMNIIYGFPEDAGLDMLGLNP